MKFWVQLYHQICNMAINKKVFCMTQKSIILTQHFDHSYFSITNIFTKCNAYSILLWPLQYTVLVFKDNMTAVISFIPYISYLHYIPPYASSPSPQRHTHIFPSLCFLWWRPFWWAKSMCTHDRKTVGSLCLLANLKGDPEKNPHLAFRQ